MDVVDVVMNALKTTAFVGRRDLSRTRVYSFDAVEVVVSKSLTSEACLTTSCCCSRKSLPNIDFFQPRHVN